MDKIKHLSYLQSSIIVTCLFAGFPITRSTLAIKLDGNKLWNRQYETRTPPGSLIRSLFFPLEHIRLLPFTLNVVTVPIALLWYPRSDCIETQQGQNKKSRQCRHQYFSSCWKSSIHCVFGLLFHGCVCNCHSYFFCQTNIDSGSSWWINVPSLRQSTLLFSVGMQCNVYIFLASRIFPTSFCTHLISAWFQDNPELEVSPGKGFDVVTQGHLIEHFHVNNVCVNWDYSPSRELTSIVYPLFEYSVVIYLCLDFAAIVLANMRGEIHPWFWSFSKIAFPVQIFLCSQFRKSTHDV